MNRVMGLLLGAAEWGSSEEIDFWQTSRATLIDGCGGEVCTGGTGFTHHHPIRNVRLDFELLHLECDHARVSGDGWSRPASSSPMRIGGC